MSATYMHVGVPVTELKEGMTYNEGMKIWMSNPDDYDYKIEYLKFEPGNPFPLCMHHRTHIAYKVDDMQQYLDKADEIIFPKTKIGDNVHIAFIVMDDTIIELYEEK